jgi:hypothetical protein
MNKILVLALAGFVVGALIAEFKPDLFNDAFGGLKAAFAGPYSEYRNHLAVRWGLAGAAGGAVIGLVMGQMGKK